MDMPPQRYAVAVVIPEPVAGRLRTLQEIYALPPWTPSIPLHITLVPPFTKHMSPEELTARIGPAVSGRTAFAIVLEGFGRFDHTESVLFVDAPANPELDRLVIAIRASLAGLIPTPRNPFRGHVTIAAMAPKEIVDDYLHRLAGERIHEEFTCDRVSLLRLDEQANAWNVVRDFPFLS